MTCQWSMSSVNNNIFHNMLLLQRHRTPNIRLHSQNIGIIPQQIAQLSPQWDSAFKAYSNLLHRTFHCNKKKNDSEDRDSLSCLRTAVALSKEHNVTKKLFSDNYSSSHGAWGLSDGRK